MVPDVAYVVGLMATDGNLAREKAMMSIVSKDRDLLETVQRCLGLTARIVRHTGGYGSRCHRVQWQDRAFYDWLRGIGLTPAKSLTLGPLTVPDAYFADFFRGCIDGDGSVLIYTDRHHVAKDNRYVYERLYVSIVSASERFIEWLQTTVSRLTGAAGTVGVRRGNGKRPMWILRYAKADSIRVIRWMHYAPGLPSLERKRIKAEKFLSALGRAPVRPSGRPRVGWIYEASRAREHEAGWFLSGWVPRILVAGACRNLADDADSKSAARKGVGVQIPSPPPTRLP